MDNYLNINSPSFQIQVASNVFHFPFKGIAITLKRTPSNKKNIHNFEINRSNANINNILSYLPPFNII